MSARKKHQPPRRLFKQDRPSPVSVVSIANSKMFGQESMSDVLRDFAEPYLPMANCETELRSLFNLAILGWNAALLPEKQRQASIETYFKATLRGAPEDELAKAWKFVKELIQRKETLFAANKRAFVSVSLSNNGSKFQLHVKSAF
ncbi:hypothetical protein [Singulisphaera acidiphila]|uniref:Uncharacterized protein n=1 Tax=Singulisphaera acidiphila (strain ATCC BAA-1392 / DSM 18658 / VKM B-2454 / MOB10) TaxID=886293 RepID=L0DM14_SINAD|nr:hypothetical protein [Singulisphaera acidiphila]AGA29868.1 hypothetical protein Sinac_5738 [Singulisphaera acidiphila DSM 18658]